MIAEDQEVELDDALAGQDDPVTGTGRAWCRPNTILTWQ